MTTLKLYTICMIIYKQHMVPINVKQKEMAKNRQTN